MWKLENKKLKQKDFFRRGQSLIEILIAIAIGAILIGGATGIIIPLLNSDTQTKNVQAATTLAQEYLDNIHNLSESNWFNIYTPPAPKGSSSQFYLSATSTSYSILPGSTSTLINNISYTVYFSVENVSRNLCGAGDINTASTTGCGNGPGTTGVADDPSTQKVTVQITWPTNGSLSKSEYFTRTTNKIFDQTDWSGGSGQDGPITSENNRFSTSSGVDSTNTGVIKIQGI